MREPKTEYQKRIAVSLPDDVLEYLNEIMDFR